MTDATTGNQRDEAAERSAPVGGGRGPRSHPPVQVPPVTLEGALEATLASLEARRKRCEREKRALVMLPEEVLAVEVKRLRNAETAVGAKAVRELRTMYDRVRFQQMMTGPDRWELAWLDRAHAALSAYYKAAGVDPDAEDATPPAAPAAGMPDVAMMALDPSRWDTEMNTAWHRAIPDVHAAFAALRVVVRKRIKTTDGKANA